MEQTRKLDKLETMLANRNYIVNVVVPIRLIPINLIDVARLEQAVYKVIKSQPNLSASLRKDGEDIYFSPLKEINDYFEVLPQSRDWKDVCIEYNNKHLREDFETYPPIKLFYIQPSDDNINKEVYLVLVYSHYAMDGTNALSITNDIMTTYTKLKNNPDYSPTSHQPPISTMEMIEKELSPEEYEECLTKYNRYHLDILDSLNCCMPIEHVDDETTKIVFTPYSSRESVFESFKAECRKNGVTVGAALCAAECFGFATSMFTRQQVPDEVYFNLEIPINLRGRVANDIPWTCGNLTVVNPYIGVGVTRLSEFWELAKQVKAKLEYVLCKENKFYLMETFFPNKMFTSLEDKKLLTKAKEVLKGLNHSLCFSNMKRYVNIFFVDEIFEESILLQGALIKTLCHTS